MNAPENSDHRVARMTGCVRVGWWLVAMALLLVLLVVGLRCSHPVWMWIRHGKTQHELRTKTVMKDMSIALGHFHTEYNRYPVPEGPENSHIGHNRPPPYTKRTRSTALRSEGVLITALLGFNDALNPREIKFLELPAAKDGRFGVIALSEHGESSRTGLKLVDKWGESYHLSLDTDNDGEVANPEAGADPAWLEKHRPPPNLKIRAAIFSSGPDRDPATWADNITNWR